MARAVPATGAALSSSATTWLGNRPRGGFDLTVDGVCPGPAFISVTGGTLGGGMAILSSTAPGSDPVPAGPCAGVVTGLTAPSPLALVGLDANGGFFLPPTLPGGACGLLLQMLDATTCALSPVTALP